FGLSRTDPLTAARYGLRTPAVERVRHTHEFELSAHCRPPLAPDSIDLVTTFGAATMRARWFVFLALFTWVVCALAADEDCSNALDARDQKGHRYIEQMLRLAGENGEGWVEYQWFNPCTGEYSDKRTFFKKVGRFVVAVGAYRNPKSIADTSGATTVAARAY